MCLKKIFNYITVIGILSFIVLATTLSSSINADDYVDPNIFGGGVSSSSSSSTSTSSTYNSGNPLFNPLINELLYGSSSSTSSSSGGSVGTCKTNPGSERYCTDCGPCGENQGMCFNSSQCASGLVCSNYTCVRSSSGDCRIQEGTLTYCAVCGPCSEGQSVCHDDSECVRGLVCTSNGFCVRSSNPSSSSSGGCRLPEGVESYCDPLVCGPCREGQGRCSKAGDCISGLVCDSSSGICVRPSSSGTCNSTPGSERYCTDCGPCREGQGMCFNDSQCGGGDLVCSNYTCIRIKRESSTDGCRLTPPCEGYCDPHVCGPCKEGEGWCDNDSECVSGLVCTINGFCVRPSIPPNDYFSNNNCRVPVGSATYCDPMVCGPCREGQGKCSKDTDCIKGLVCSKRTGLCKKP